MPQGPDWKQLLEAGMNVTELRRAQARQIVADLVAQGQLAQDRATAAVDEVLEMSRRRREELRSFVQAEIQRQVGALGIATKDDLARLERKIAAAPKSRRDDDDGGQEGRRRRRRRREKAAAKKTAARPRAVAPRAPVRRRLDVELVRRGLAPSRARAVELIASGRVTVGGAPAEQCGASGRRRGSGRGRCPRPNEYVSRGGHKLRAALDAFAIDPRGRRALDAGASTGGFTDCLLQAGAAAVVARRRRPRPARVGAARRTPASRSSSAPTCATCTRARSASRSTWSSSTCRSSRCGSSRRTCSSWPLPAPTSCCWSSPSSRRAATGSGRAAWCATRPGAPRRAGRSRAPISTPRASGSRPWSPSPLRGADGNVEFLARARPGAATVVGSRARSRPSRRSPARSGPE